ncbi:STAS/SEC14 domain-containing protein [Hymenobacter sp. BT730]|uniref:STAS/SEC14 domain-containing protein n=1 Tax=Hymenobacter sp. BT730 TaxID=3063332 RepID=UPI0026DEC9FF|nr:STAS/SEC14 domain-containing protein [Hymenobacter sp. BT730]
MFSDHSNGTGTDSLLVAYDPQNLWVHCTWTGEYTYEGIIAGLEACLALLVEHHCAHMLSDIRHLIGLWDTLVDWFVVDWCPRARAQGVTCIAIVVSPESLVAQSARAAQQSMGPDTRPEVRLFLSNIEAEAWLRQRQEEALL